MKRIDPLTGELFQPKRVTQRFASAQNRIRYHNKMAGEMRHSTSFINKQLQSNVRILNQLLDNRQEDQFDKTFLQGIGFSFNVFTHFAMFDNQPRNAIYNFIIIPVEPNQIQIIKT